MLPCVQLPPSLKKNQTRHLLVATKEMQDTTARKINRLSYRAIFGLLCSICQQVIVFQHLLHCFLICNCFSVLANRKSQYLLLFVTTVLELHIWGCL